MKIIYQSTIDDTLYDTEEECIKYEKELVTRDKLSNLISCVDEMSVSGLTNFILKHKDLIVNILTVPDFDAVVEKPQTFDYKGVSYKAVPETEYADCRGCEFEDDMNGCDSAPIRCGEKNIIWVKNPKIGV